MMEWLQHPRSEEEVLQRLSERPERQGADSESLRHELEAALSWLDPACPMVDWSRYDLVSIGFPVAWPGSGVVGTRPAGSCSGRESASATSAARKAFRWPFAELAAGTFSLPFSQTTTSPLEPWTWRRSTKDTLFLYDPPKSRIEVDPDVDAFGSEGEDDEPATVDPDDDGTESEDRPTQLGLFDRNLDPTSLRLWNAGEKGLPGTEDLLRPVLLHKGRGTRCPVCFSRYGSFDILTPVSLGNSSALGTDRLRVTHLRAI